MPSSCYCKSCTARRSCFRYTGLDYVYQISMLQQKKKRVVLDSLTNFVSAYNTFFHQVVSSHCSMSLLLMFPYPRARTCFPTWSLS